MQGFPRDAWLRQAAIGATHALYDLVAPKHFAKQLAGELADSIWVKDDALYFGTAAGILQSVDTQLCISEEHSWREKIAAQVPSIRFSTGA